MTTLTLLLLPSIHASEDYIELPVESREQAIAVVMAYGITKLDDAYVSACHVSDIADPVYELVLSFSELRDHCGNPDPATEFDHTMYSVAE